MAAVAVPIAPAAAAPVALPTPEQEWLATVGEELPNHACKVYLLSFSRVLPETLQASAGELRSLEGLTRDQLCEFVRDSFANPAQNGALGGRPREEDTPLVLKLVVVKEAHADGTTHFHVAVLLSRRMKFAAAKRTLRNRHKLVAHFSCSHTLWWSALRYCVSTTTKKPAVDEGRLVWTAEGETCDPVEESREPYNAAGSRKKREKDDNKELAQGKPCRFTKSDFNSLVISKGLVKKNQVIRYVQEHGTEAMRTFVTNHQRKLNELLEEAVEWNDAPRVAAEEDLTDWALLCLASESSCCHGDDCPYRIAIEEILDKNAESFDRRHLAASLRKIILSGPGKDSRVPFLVGCTNSGKSTVVDSFDDLYGAAKVFHLPAMTDGKYALSNWKKSKRFVYWDECDPVAFADEGVISTTTFKKAFGGQYFEIQVTQSLNDGNQDFRWKQGAVFTNKEEGLWRTTENVSAEDLRHLKSRVEMFRFTHQLFPEGEAPPRGNVEQCRHHLAKWIVTAATAFDAAQGMLPLPAPAGYYPCTQVDADESSSPVADLEQFLKAAKLPVAAEAALAKDVVATGAVNVQELSKEDWEQLPSWVSLKPLERRRLLFFVRPTWG